MIVDAYGAPIRGPDVPWRSGLRYGPHPEAPEPFGGLERRAWDVILIDPPWEFKTRSDKGQGRPRPYPVMTVPEIAALPVRELAARDCFMVMWTTWTHLVHAMDVLDAWGFKYATGGTWTKTQKNSADLFRGPKLANGTGYYFRLACEPWLIATRGSPGRWKGVAIPNAMISDRREHSRKPDAMYEALERAYPNRRKLEIFSRNVRPGWTMWGNQVGHNNRVDAGLVG